MEKKTHAPLAGTLQLIDRFWRPDRLPLARIASRTDKGKIVLRPSKPPRIDPGLTCWTACDYCA